MNRAFVVGIVLNVVYVLAEAGLGLWANSLALLADSGHNLSDVLGLLLAWGANALATRRPTARRTYGWRRSTILAALANALLLLIAVGAIAWEAVRRFAHPEPVAGLVVVAAAAVGVLINGATTLLFASGRHRDINVRGAYLHMAADTAVSAAVVVAGLAIRATGWEWIDPATSLAVVVVITLGTWSLLRESLDLALDAAPAGLDVEAVQAYLRSLPGVAEVHHLHVWAMSTTETALTAHLVKPDGALDNELLRRASHELHDRFGIEHATLQLERADAGNCCSSPDENACRPEVPKT